MTQSHNATDRPHEPRAPAPGTAAERARRERIQKQLDDALAASFPASDPVAIVTSHEEEDLGSPGSED